ncbi:MAG: cytidine deaminase [Elusimicrobia bacterium]|nr:cytidine deaminase [Elusimicrobiota bacterium]
MASGNNDRLSSKVLRKLARLAIESRDHAYAPYSKFYVGAALLADNGRTYTGSNVENASYGLTVCAERVAIFRAIHDGAKAIRAIAVATGHPQEKTPCGACLQVMMEFALPPMEIIISRGKKEPLSQHWSCYLPQPFKFPAVKKNY